MWLVEGAVLSFKALELVLGFNLHLNVKVVLQVVHPFHVLLHGEELLLSQN